MQHPWIDQVRAISFDLDDTLWPIEPCIVMAEQVTHAWLVRQAPGFERHCSLADLRRWRADVEGDWPAHRLHDLGALRHESLRRAVVAAGFGPDLAASAFQVFMEQRQQVCFYADTQAALEHLAGRYRLFAISNGNADLRRTGLSRWIEGGVSAAQAGVAKPDVRIFAAACRRLGLAPRQVLHVGDDPHRDVAGARAAGMYSAWVRRPGSPHAETSCEPHLQVDNLLELAGLLAGGSLAR